jgi:hypothetical protein
MEITLSRTNLSLTAILTTPLCSRSLYPNLEAEVASSDSNITNMTEYISVGEALKLVAPFKGERGMY